MAVKLDEFETISRAIQATYNKLKEEEQYSMMAVESLREAEESLNKAIEHSLSQNGNAGFMR